MTLKPIGGLLLCVFGIEYVDDPKTGKKIPTCHRTQVKSIFNCDEYLNVIKYSDVISKEIYQEEAMKISEIQKGILSISQKEEPYDIFICYKETDSSGNRAIDSVLAQDIYDELTNKGYKVFFSKITLESKLGKEYEPIIFAALNSSKVMIVIGTKEEYFNAVWVKNEWSRFLSLLERGDNLKYIIPCYKDMDIIDIPIELRNFQCQDLNKLGFLQDLVRGIDKLFNKSEEAYFTNINQDNALKRVSILLSDGNFAKANELIENLLNNDPEDAQLYYMAFLCELRFKNEDELLKYRRAINYNYNFKKALLYANTEFKEKLLQIEKVIMKNVEEDSNEISYQNALNAISRNDLTTALKYFEQAKGYKDANEKYIEVERKVNEGYEAKYQYAKKLMKNNEYTQAIRVFEEINFYKDSSELLDKSIKTKDKEIKYRKCLTLLESNKIQNIEIAIKALSTIKDYRDSEELVSQAKIDLEKLITLKEEKKKKYKKITTISLSICGVLIVIIIALVTVVIPSIKENNTNKAIVEAEELIELGEYEEAYLILSAHQSNETVQEMLRLIQAHNCFDKNDFENGINIIKLIGGKITYEYDLDGGIVVNDVYNKKGYQFEKLEYVSAEINNESYDCVIKMKAKWSIINYTITYNLDGGTADGELPTTFNVESEFKFPTITKPGYEFAYWIDAKDKRFEINEYLKEYNSDLKIRAVYTKATYTITYDVKGGDPLPDKEVIYNEYFNLDTPTRHGYEFKGWYINGVKYTKNLYTFTKDITLESKWEPLNYQISYKNLPSNYTLPDTYTINSEFTIPSISKSNYEFIGWKDENGNIVKEYAIEKGTTGDIALEAIFKPIEYKIIYDANGGEVEVDYTIVKYNEEYELIKPTREGYKFIGWLYNDAPITDDIYQYSYDIEVVAKWEEIN